MSKYDILFVEDDENLGNLVTENLTANGYKVTWLKDGVTAEECINKHKFSLCIFDVMLPGEDGYALAEKYRAKWKNSPFVFLTARGIEADKFKGFELGADDYITKPFSFKELMYRINVVLRRSGQVQDENIGSIKIGSLTYDVNKRLVEIAGKEKKLSQREGALLQQLLLNKGKYITRSELLNNVWGNDDYFTGKSMEVYITRLRNILKDTPEIVIENLYGTGYRINYVS